MTVSWHWVRQVASQPQVSHMETTGMHTCTPAGYSEHPADLRFWIVGRNWRTSGRTCRQNTAGGSEPRTFTRWGAASATTLTRLNNFKNTEIKQHWFFFCTVCRSEKHPVALQKPLASFHQGYCHLEIWVQSIQLTPSSFLIRGDAVERSARWIQEKQENRSRKVKKGRRSVSTLHAPDTVFLTLMWAVCDVLPTLKRSSAGYLPRWCKSGLNLLI